MNELDLYIIAWNSRIIHTVLYYSYIFKTHAYKHIKKDWRNTTKFIIVIASQKVGSGNRVEDLSEIQISE